jgi:hypothetical protein
MLFMDSRKKSLFCSLSLTIATVLIAVSSAASQPVHVPFDSTNFDLSQAEVLEHLGRTAVQGVASLKDVEFENGIIEFDIAVSEVRAYPGVDFRIQSPGDYEQFYIRPHVNKFRTDALQYTPVFNGIAGWQLYNGEGFTAVADIEHDRWIHIKLEVKDNQARVFFDTIPEPALIINDLKHGISKGAIRLTGQPGAITFYSNFSYELTDSLSFDPPPEVMFPRGIITNWELSQVLAFRDIDYNLYPDSQNLPNLVWEPVTADSSGLLDIGRHRSPLRTEASAVCVRTLIHADSNMTRLFSFGYSDVAIVFHNGHQLFVGNSSYKSRDNHFSGIIGLNDNIAVPLVKGENELLFIVVEMFGGWGLMCKDRDYQYQDNALTKLWELQYGMRYPESALYDAKRDQLYISQYYNQRGNEFVSRIALDGTVIEMEWVSGLDRPLGMCLLNDRLYIAERKSMVMADVESGEILERYPVPGAVFLNDITADSSGNLYITDSDMDGIHIFHDGEFSVWLEGDEVKDPNGIVYDNGKIIFGNSGDGCWKIVNPTTMSIDTLARFEPGSLLDGLKPDGRGNYIVSDFNGRVFSISPDGVRTELLNGTAFGQKYADMEYIPEKRLLIIPTLYSNQIMMFRY